MRALVVGATGGTGLRLVREALERDVEVTVVVRSPEKLSELTDRVRVVTGSPLDVTTVREAAVGCDAAFSTIGSQAGFLGRGATTVYSSAAAALLEALPQVDVRRLLFCTSAGVESDGPGEALPYKLIAKPLFLQRTYDDMTLAEDAISASSLDWTLVRPGRLTNGAGTGRYTVSPRFRAPGGRGIPRADVAKFMPDEVEARQWVHATPTLTS